MHVVLVEWLKIGLDRILVNNDKCVLSMDICLSSPGTILGPPYIKFTFIFLIVLHITVHVCLLVTLICYTQVIIFDIIHKFNVLNQSKN